MQNTINPQNTSRKIALIGTGISNLTLLHLLKKTPNLKMNIIMFERSKVIGGRVATRKRENLLYDNGANYFDFNDKRIENLIMKDLPTKDLFKINKPVFLFNQKNEIFTKENLPSFKNYKSIFSYFNSDDRNFYTYSKGIKTLPELLLNTPERNSSEEFSYEVKFSKIISRLDSKFKFDENNKLNYYWNLFTDENENLGCFDKIIFGTPSLNIAKVFDKSDFSVVKKLNFYDKPSGEKFGNFENREKEFFANVKNDLNLLTYKKVFSMGIAYENSNNENYFKNDFFGLVNIDNKHFISTVFVENEKNKECLVNSDKLFLVVQFHENEFTKKLNFEKDKELIIEAVKENLEKLIPQLKGKKVLFHDLKSWGFSFPNNKIIPNLIQGLSERNIEIVGDSISGIGKIDKSMLTSFDLYEKLIKI